MPRECSQALGRGGTLWVQCYATKSRVLTMSELRRLAYLEALGIDGYVSRAQLPGAAATRRLAVVKPAANALQKQAITADAAQQEAGAHGLLDSLRSSAPKPDKEPLPESKPMGSGGRNATGVDVPRLSLSVIAAGQWLWLEMLGDMPLMSEQVWLVESMAIALTVAKSDGAAAGPAIRSATKANVMQFDWPIHNNPQIDEGPEAARASLGGFLERQQHQLGAKGLVLMGDAASEWVAVNSVSIPCVAISTTREMLGSPALKRPAWQALQVLLDP